MLFYNKCVRNVIEKAVKVFVIILQDKEVKKKSTLQLYQSFEHNSMKIHDQKRLGSLEEKKEADMVSEGFARFIAKGDWLVNSRDVNPLETI